MLISKKWLQQYMDINDITMEEIADKITSAGLEVEGISYMSQGNNLTIGYIESCENHPDSDHLHICQVNLGDEGVKQIVCGAPNVAANQKVIVAKENAQLPGGVIKKSVIRGVESNGMICSLLELGVDGKLLSEESKNGIEILDADAPIGYHDPLGYLGYDDVILDVGLTPNRNDCMAAWSMALETGAIINKEVSLPKYENASKIGSKSKLKVHSETDKCPLFLGKVINNITIKPSIPWMKELLQASGMKAINNVVDISNIVMLETGQPLHFYDIDAIPAQDIVVKDQEELDYTALDGITYNVKPNDLLVTTNNHPLCIAGVMGGNDSKIKDDTRGIIIEAAIFNHVSIRNTARRLNLNTDASIRYQKGIEPLATFKAMDRAVQLLIEYADAKEIEETIQYGDANYHVTNFDVSLKSINQLLGTDFKMDEVMKVLSDLHFDPKNDEDKINVTIPSYRQDISMEADIAEEIIRILGYDRLPSTLPSMPATLGCLDNRQKMRRRISEILSNIGYNEAVTYSLVSKDQIENGILPIAGESIRLASPMSEDKAYVRNSILPSLLTSVAYNQARKQKDVALFEISNVYAKDKVEEHLAIVASGALSKNRWQKFSLDVDFYSFKGLLYHLLEAFGFNENRIMIKPNDLDTNNFHPYRSAQVYLGKQLLAIFGQIHPQLAKKYEIEETYGLELNLEVLLSNKASKVKYSEISKYPAVTRDLALIVDRDVCVGDIEKSIKKNGKLGNENVIQSVEVFDVYMGEHVAKNQKSIALSIIFQSFARTLTDKEVNALFEQILASLEKDVNATLRS